METALLSGMVTEYKIVVCTKTIVCKEEGQH